MEIPGLTLTISSDKAAVRKDEIVTLSARLQHSGSPGLLLNTPKSDEMLWLFHIEVATPVPQWIPLPLKAARTIEGERRIDFAGIHGDKTRLWQAGREYTGSFDLNKIYQMQQPGDYRVTVWSWVGVVRGPHRQAADAQWVTVASNELTITVVP